MGSHRLALFVPSLRGGGAERVMVTLARGFAERGHAVDLVLVRAEGPFLTEVPDAVRIVDLKAHRTLASLPALVRYLRRERPTAMLSAMDHANLVAVWAQRLARHPRRMVASVHNVPSRLLRPPISIRDRLLLRLLRHWYSKVDTAVAVSAGVAAELSELAGIPQHRTAVVHNPVRIAEIRKLAREPLHHPWIAPDAPPLIVGCGRLTSQKDFEMLLRAFASVRKRRPIRLVILGEGPKRSELESLVRRLGVEADVELPGFVGNPYPWFAACAVFVLSSRWEGLSLVLIEALACGARVISTDCPSGPAEVLGDGRWGALVPVGDPGALSFAIDQALDRPEARAAPFDAMARFQSDHVLATYERLLLGEPPRSPRPSAR